MIDLWIIPFVVSLLFFIGAYFTKTNAEETKNDGKGTLIKIFMFLGAALFMWMASTMSIQPLSTAYYQYPAYNVITNTTSNGIPTNTIQKIPAINVSEIDNPAQPQTIYDITWLGNIYIIICILFALFSIFTGGVTANQ